ncbi:MAG: hypothetical protein ACRD8O_09600, partial [Bryobacteraceae bacterium]
MPLEANVTRNYRLIAIAFVVLMLGAGVLLYVSFREPTDSLVSKLFGTFDNVVADELWFTSNGALTGIRRDASRISLMVWAPNENRLQRQENVDLDGFDGIASAVSWDTSLAAWTAGDVLRVRQVGVNRPPSSAPIGKGTGVVSIALAGSR